MEGTYNRKSNLFISRAIANSHYQTPLFKTPSSSLLQSAPRFSYHRPLHPPLSGISHPPLYPNLPHLPPIHLRFLSLRPRPLQTAKTKLLAGLRGGLQDGALAFFVAEDVAVDPFALVDQAAAGVEEVVPCAHCVLAFCGVVVCCWFGVFWGWGKGMGSAEGDFKEKLILAVTVWNIEHSRNRCWGGEPKT